jgi:hypothetical protein
MPGEIAPALRLLQAVCYPGHGALLFGDRVELTTGDAAALGLYEVARAQPGESAFTVTLDDAFIACVRRRGLHTLVVAVPREMSAVRVHEKLATAIVLYERRIGITGPPSGGGSSGAPAEVSIACVRARPS